MLRSSLFDFVDAYILVSGTKTVAEVASGRGNNSIQVVFKNCAPFFFFFFFFIHNNINYRCALITNYMK